MRQTQYQAGSFAPLVAGVEYFSGLDAGGGYLLIPWMGKPLEISWFTTTASPRTWLEHLTTPGEKPVRTELLPKALRTEMV